MAERKLLVRIIGDAKSLARAFTESIGATKAFGQQRVQVMRGIEKQEEESLLRLKSRRAQALGPLRIAAGTLGGGAAVFAAIQGLRALADGLRVAGDEAFTSEGKFRNFAAELASGNIVGGLQALAAQETRLAPDLEAAVTALKKMRDEASRITLQEVLDQTDSFDQKMLKTERDLVAIGIPIDEAKTKTAEWRAELERIAGTDLGKLNEGIASFTGALVTGIENVKAALEAATRARDQTLTGLGELPPGIQAAISREQGPTGTKGGLLDVLRQADKNLVRRIKDVGELGSGRDVSEQLARLQSQRTSVFNQIQALLKPPKVTKTSKAAVASGPAFEALDDLAAQNAAIAKRLQEAQFRALGLTADGNRQTPTIANLLKQVSSLSKNLGGTSADTANNRGLLARIRAVLIDPINKATPETRAAAKGLLDVVKGDLGDGLKKAITGGPLTATTSLNASLLDGLGLGRDMEKELRARLSSFNSAGVALSGSRGLSSGVGGDIVIQNSLIVDGEKFASNTTRHQQKTKRRNPAQKRGPNRIGA